MVHKGLRRFIEEDDASGLQPAVVPKLRRITFRLDTAQSEIVDLNYEDYH